MKSSSVLNLAEGRRLTPQEPAPVAAASSSAQASPPVPRSPRRRCIAGPRPEASGRRGRRCGRRLPNKGYRLTDHVRRYYETTRT